MTVEVSLRLKASHAQNKIYRITLKGKTMKNIVLLILTICLSHESIAQDLSNKTENTIKIKLKKAKGYIKKKKFDKALKKVDEIETLSNGKMLALTQNIRIKVLIGKEEFTQAQVELDKLYGMEPSVAILKDMAIYVRVIEDGLTRKWPGEIFQDCTDCPVMVVIPSGSFKMGSDDGDDDEQPIHRVAIKQFSMGQTEVTFKQWDACYDAGGCSYNPEDKGWGRGNRPVINVTWNDAKEYITWLNNQTGKHYRLPSESEWEYAARSGSSKKYSWGNNIDCSQARYGFHSDECGKQFSTDPVKSFASNKFKLYDMHGNVWEWVEDKWHDNYSGAPSKGESWIAGSVSNRVMRGGSWYYFASGLRSANRFQYAPTSRDFNTGFRLAQD